MNAHFDGRWYGSIKRSTLRLIKWFPVLSGWVHTTTFRCCITSLPGDDANPVAVSDANLVDGSIDSERSPVVAVDIPRVCRGRGIRDFRKPSRVPFLVAPRHTYEEGDMTRSASGPTRTGL